MDGTGEDIVAAVMDVMSDAAEDWKNAFLLLLLLGG